MKRIILIIVLSVFTGTFLLSPSKSSAQTMARDDVKNMVVKAIGYPQTAVDKQLEGEVVVSFSSNGKGKIEVQEINGSIPELKEYVFNKISAIELPESMAEVSDPILLRFNFKLI